MYFCYIDDSGDSKTGSTMSVLLVEDRHWSGLLAEWIVGRRKVHNEWGLGKNTEVHANKLLKGRGRFCDTEEQDKAFNNEARAAAARVLLKNLANYRNFTLWNFGMETTRNHELYVRVIDHIEEWASEQDTYVTVFYDGLQGFKHLLDDDEKIDPLKIKEQWLAAGRNASVYRSVHRELDIKSRRVIEDVIMLDSKYNQLIQAADLAAYCGYHKHLQDHPEIWGKKNRALPGAARAYMALRNHWPEESDNGMIWFDEEP